MKHMYTLGIVATILVVLAAGNPDELFQRLWFVLLSLFAGYLVILHRFKVRYYTRLKRAFNSRRLHAKYSGCKYRRLHHFQTA